MLLPRKAGSPITIDQQSVACLTDGFRTCARFLAVPRGTRRRGSPALPSAPRRRVGMAVGVGSRCRVRSRAGRTGRSPLRRWTTAGPGRTWSAPADPPPFRTPLPPNRAVADEPDPGCHPRSYPDRSRRVHWSADASLEPEPAAARRTGARRRNRNRHPRRTPEPALEPDRHRSRNPKRQPEPEPGARTGPAEPEPAPEPASNRRPSPIRPEPVRRCRRRSAGGRTAPRPRRCYAAGPQRRRPSASSRRSACGCPAVRPRRPRPPV